MKKVCKRKVYPLINPIEHAINGACITSDEKISLLKKMEKDAIEAMKTGEADIYSWQTLVDINNTCQVMARRGIGAESLIDSMMAEIELKQAAKRFEATGKMYLTEIGLKSINEVLEWHNLQRTSISRSQFERMIEKTRNKIRSRSKDVTVIE